MENIELDAERDIFNHVIKSFPYPTIVVNNQRVVKGYNNKFKEIFLNIERNHDLAFTIRNPTILDTTTKCINEKAELLSENIILLNPFRHFNVSFSSLYTIKYNIFYGVMLCFEDHTSQIKNEEIHKDFIANLSHELRSPLSSLMGFTETLQKDKVSIANQKKFLKIMSKEGLRMNRLINGLLSLSKIEAREYILPEENIDLLEIVNSTIAVFKNEGKKKNINIKLETNLDKLPNINGDRDEIIIVFRNLLENAILYSKNNTQVKINVLSDIRIPNSSISGIRIDIVNIGEYIPKTVIPRLTERFYRIDKSRTNYGGSGLGLSIVKHILNRHKGIISIESSEKSGNKFSVYLPTAGNVIKV